MTKESAADLERLYTSVMQIYRSLETLRRSIETWDDFLVFIIVQRLDSESVKGWEQFLGSDTELPTLLKLTQFLVSRLRSLQAFVKSRASKSSIQPQLTTIKVHYQGKSKEKDVSQGLGCSLCSDKHHPSNCPQYRSKLLKQKLELVAKHKLCYNCLGIHRVVACRTVKRCLKCGRKHHTSIHSGSSQSTKVKSDSNEPAKAGKQSTCYCYLHLGSSSGYALDPNRNRSYSSGIIGHGSSRILSPNGNVITVRALIDQGSEVSLITERIVQRLRMTRTHSTVPLTGIDGKASSRTRRIVSFHLRPNFQANFECTVTAHILTNLTSDSISPNKSDLWPHLDGLQFADPQFSRPGAIDLILGADLYGSIIAEDLVRGSPDSLIAQLTHLGWIISGPTSHPEPPTGRRIVPATT
ncbi:PREDICTED: uncharacterized protein LOC108758261 [Trachymyrmex cornetzi]|uniref:uncharacterized protein LOC108758261 n=1 Tax=Trachymyrmex cornetzi TaxID=471704 RepID=UPI00084F70E3|nr:PREDICTED: uncharacterized protein LOC108758261 [Trachymyrmex cornetzi]